MNLDGTELDVKADGRRDFHICRDPDAKSDGIVGRPPAPLFLAQLCVARRCESGVERLFVLAGVVRGTGVGRQRELVRLDEVAPPDLCGVHSDLLRGDVDHSLDQLSGFGTASSSVRADRGGVGDNGPRRELDLLDVVHADRHHLCQHRQDRTDGRVRTGVRGDIALYTRDLSVVGDAEFGGHHVVAAVDQ